MELDELIGEIRREAALRRAAPDFPVDQEASVSAALDALGPVGAGRSGADLAATVARMRQLGREGAPQPPDQLPPDNPASGPDRLDELALLAASAVNALTARLDHLQRRVVRVPAPARAPKPGPGLVANAHPEVVDYFLGSTGPVVAVGPEVSEWVAALEAAGIDAAGVDLQRPEFSDEGAVRAGSLPEHLASIGAGTLGGVLVVGPQPTGEAPGLFDLCEDLVRVARRIAVCSEAPWAWRLRLGDAAADIALYRPLSPEAWLDGLARAGLAATGSYGPEGTDYVILAPAPAPASTED